MPCPAATSQGLVRNGHNTTYIPDPYCGYNADKSDRSGSHGHKAAPEPRQPAWAAGMTRLLQSSIGSPDYPSSTSPFQSFSITNFFAQTVCVLFDQSGTESAFDPQCSAALEAPCRKILSLEGQPDQLQAYAPNAQWCLVRGFQSQRDILAV